MNIFKRTSQLEKYSNEDKNRLTDLEEKFDALINFLELEIEPDPALKLPGIRRIFEARYHPVWRKRRKEEGELYEPKD